MGYPNTRFTLRVSHKNALGSLLVSRNSHVCVLPHMLATHGKSVKTPNVLPYSFDFVIGILYFFVMHMKELCLAVILSYFRVLGYLTVKIYVYYEKKTTLVRK